MRGLVLVIDDEQDQREMLAALLEKRGYRVVTASNGRNALELLGAVTPTMILLDVDMPVMNGLEFRQAQRQDRDLVGIPTIVVSGHTTEPVLDPGIAAVLRKPFSCDRLLELVERYSPEPVI